MSFNIALSGLNAASAYLNVTAHNIANAGTLGFKENSIEFAEVLVSGVRVAATPQQFSNGNIEFTGSSLDLAINGDGFFTLKDNGALAYARAGAFGVDAEGYVVNSSNQRLQVYPEAGRGVFDIGALRDLRLSIADSQPRATTSGEVGANLPANSQPPISPVFDATDADSYNNTTSTTVYDSLGTAHTATFYFVKGAGVNDWEAHLAVDGTPVGGAQALQFSDSGTLLSPADGIIDFPAIDPGTGAAMLDLEFDFSLSTQFGGDFSVQALTQDGFATGLLTGIDIDQEGIVLARFTNGVSEALGQVAMSRFPNPQGLQPDGDNTWIQTFDSGEPLRGTAGSSNFGMLQSGALEQSNVDLTSELVNMIIAQRNFQANAQMISTSDAVTQTIINLR